MKYRLLSINVSTLSQLTVKIGIILSDSHHSLSVYYIKLSAVVKSFSFGCGMCIKLIEIHDSRVSFR